MSKIGFVLDMDGTIYKGNNPISGSLDFIEYLQKSEIPFRFFTNNSSHTRAFYNARLRRMGFDVDEDHILNSTVATVRFLKEKYPESKVYVMASVDVTQEIKSMGITSCTESPDIVLLTFDTSITYEKINAAYHYILAGAKLVATHPDDLCPTEDAYDVDIGPFIELLESMTGTKAEIIGKPNPLALDMAALEMSVDKSNLVMVGDRISTDIRMAADANIRSIMVLSGEATEDELKNYDFKPTHIVQSVVDIPKLMLSK